MASSAFDDAVDAYLRDCERRGLRPATLRYYRMVLGRFGALCAPMTPGDLSLASVRALQDRSPQLSPGSVRGFLRALKTFSRWLTDEGLLPGDPLARLRCHASIRAPWSCRPTRNSPRCCGPSSRRCVWSWPCCSAPVSASPTSPRSTRTPFDPVTW